MKITIEGPIPSKKNSKQIVYAKGRPLIISSKSHREWHRRARAALIGVKPVTGKISHIDIYFWWPDKRRADLSNKAESILDLLVDCGIIKDDSWAEVPELLLKSAGIDRENPRAEIDVSREK